MINLTITMAHQGQRLDKVLANILPDYSRAQVQRALRDGTLKINGDPADYRQKTYEHDRVTGHIAVEIIVADIPQAMALDVVYEDDDLLVVNKPAGLVCHPAPGHPKDTLLNGLLHRYPHNESLPRAGLIHRLDRDTSGLLVCARHNVSYQRLVEQMQQRLIKRQYRCLVWGKPPPQGQVEQPIGRHPRDRKRQAVRPEGRYALTHYQQLAQYAQCALMEVTLATGRTHQIRVHMTWAGYPLVGDPVYGRPPRGADQSLRDFTRQALHAKLLHFDHPISKQPIQCQQPLPEDFAKLLAELDEV